ncbi:hypothetical protein KG088_05785 [Halomonas sp. TRM85114]|uniref:hypothetical protein n=1 Tax=Halomonas jincaotanensis TaxID=2810616 RepID=UPI001BD60D0A|nr:hypothetical protein [Halomonas jincaotanensis]MBS9403135.1 hypothetical protein [Halomonas jincaotanensis]
MTLQPPSHFSDDDALGITRRDLVRGGALGLATSWLGGCAVSTTPQRRTLPAQARVELLYYADTLDARAPGFPVVPATRLGPAQRLGQPPWLTADSAMAMTSGPQSLLLPHQARHTPVGGHAALAAHLEGLRDTLGKARTLTLENGQCWNGSGLCHLTRGEAGLAASRMLGAEARVSSDERLLWPDQVAGLYRAFEGPVLGLLGEEPNPASAVRPLALFDRGGARVAVVGVTDPHAADETRPLDAWYRDVERRTREASDQADLVIVLADCGTGAGIWLAERLAAADLLLCARGQDFWPALVSVRQPEGRTLPVCFPGCRAAGAFQLSCSPGGQGWRVETRFHLADAGQLEGEARRLAGELQQRLEADRAPFANWLDTPLAWAPHWLWRRDTVGGSWDAVINDALLSQGSADLALSPGWRHDVVLPPGSPITRDHLVSLTGGHEARLVELETKAHDLRPLLERASDHCFGSPSLLDTSQDLPRLRGAEWGCRYTAEVGRRIELGDLPGTRLATWQPGTNAGESLWQRLEVYLGERPEGWTLPPMPTVRLAGVSGHPGWHPGQRPGARE